MNKKNTKSKGALTENIVAQYLKQRGWTILFQNEKVLGVEVDILARKEKEYSLIEVKSLKKEEYIEKILKKTQKERLKKAALHLCGDIPQGLRLFLAVVNPKNQIRFFEIL